ncbi:Uncharacterised protein [Metamycoplasma arthritidis]|uniref:Uncharacterized protein n=1 Tax=Metamycoplasma arthritidis (strain 158L3-1) TaxID=243272 RepID=B3PM59_META1|nr:hypothetical protein [Metamycoplasma arthritidis]ACF07111.1 hypothetical protein MARTH_orf188 [Metamycoplasma arthritidis 158L3-1]VEU78639.1 Uncharacterised protein [Metamycoplasma arthritidis]
MKTKNKKMTLSFGIFLGLSALATLPMTMISFKSNQKKRTSSIVLPNKFDIQMSLLNAKIENFSRMNDDHKFDLLLSELNEKKTKFTNQYEANRNDSEFVEKLSNEVSDYLTKEVNHWEAYIHRLDILIREVEKLDLSNVLPWAKDELHEQLKKAKEVTGKKPKLVIQEAVNDLDDAMNYAKSSLERSKAMMLLELKILLAEASIQFLKTAEAIDKLNNAISEAKSIKTDNTKEILEILKAAKLLQVASKA